MERKETRKKRQEYYFNRLKEVVANKGGKCLSEKYIDSTTKLEFQCEKGHIWKTQPHVIVIQNHWCNVCHLDSIRNNINDIIKIVESKGGKLLTKKYKNDIQKLKIKCNKEHLWETSYCSLRRGSWCLICSRLNQKLSIEEKSKGLNLIKKIVREKGAKCLSGIDEYKNVTSKLKIQCSKGHIWKITADRIKREETWCPVCAQSISEKIFRIVMEKVFNSLFPSCRPDWLRNKYGNKLEIDGYNEELKIGFEYQGEQHFNFSAYFHKTIEIFERKKQNDITKKIILSNKNIFMLYPTYKLKKEKYLFFIYNKIKNTKYSKLSNSNLNININKLYQLL